MNTATKENSNIRALTSFELITNWLDIGYTLNLSTNTLNVMTHLLRFYNPNKKYVFPHQETLAERTKLSLATIKRAIAELIQANLLIKSRARNGNVYAFTGKLLELLNSSAGSDATAQTEPCMIRTNKRTNKTTCRVVKKETSEAPKIPSSILNNPKIKNKLSYWLSLPNEVKQVHLNKEKQEAFIKERSKKEIKTTKELLESYNSFVGVAPTESFLKLKEKLRNARR